MSDARGTSGAALRAGVVGLGQIGGGVAVCLARSGRPLTVDDVRPDAVDRWPGVPPVVGSPAEVARASDVVMIAVVDLAQTLVGALKAISHGSRELAPSGLEFLKGGREEGDGPGG